MKKKGIEPYLKHKYQKKIVTGYNRAQEYLYLINRETVKISPTPPEIYPVDQIPKYLQGKISRDTLALAQNFIGDYTGDLLFFLNQEGSTGLVNYLNGVEGIRRRITVSDREALLEIGGILLNNFLRALVGERIFNFELLTPRIIIDPGSHLFSELRNAGAGYAALVSGFNFDLSDGKVYGSGTTIIGSVSLLDMIDG